MDTWMLCACVVLMPALPAAEVYLSHEVISMVGKLLDPPALI
jgi:hypothetical protein